MKTRFNFAYATSLILTDVCAYYVALFIAYEIRVLAEKYFAITGLGFTFEYFVSLWWILALVLIIQLMSSLYHRRDPLWIESGRILRSLAISFVILFAFVSLARMNDEVSRLFLCLLWFLSLFTFVIFRIAAKKFIFKWASMREKVLLVGDEARLERVAKALDREWYMGINVVTQIAINPMPDTDLIDKIINNMEIHGAVVVPPAKDAESVMPLFSYIHTRVRRLIYVPEVGAMDMTNAETGQLLRSQLGYLSVNNALLSPVNRLLKRAFDLLLFLLLMPILLPIILILIVLVKATSDGAAFFVQERIGREGKSFKFYKFRSMYKDSEKRLAEMIAADPAVKLEWEAHFKLKNDPRITPLGKFIRRTSLDELPQYFNVLLGNMSFVGPRPILKDELGGYYREKAVYYNMATPGITGLWQVSGRDAIDYQERMNMNCWYVFNWSLWLDIVILFSTPMVVFFRCGAS